MFSTKGSRKLSTHLSSLLFVQQSCPGPTSRAHCISDNTPDNHGIRRSSDNTSCTHPHICMLIIGRLSLFELKRSGLLDGVDLTETPVDLVDERLVRAGMEVACIKAARKERRTTQTNVRIETKLQNDPIKLVRRCPVMVGNEPEPADEPFSWSRHAVADIGPLSPEEAAAERSNFVMPSHNNHASQAFPQMPLRKMSSESTSDTMTSRHGLVMSSGGSKRGRTRFTSRMHHVVSFSA